MRFQITDDFLNEYSSGTGLRIDLQFFRYWKARPCDRPSWPAIEFARNIDQKRDLVVPTLVINPFESFKDDLMYSIDERFVDGLMEGRVVTWQAKFFNCPRRGPGLGGPLKWKMKNFDRNTLFSEFSQFVYLEAFSLSSNFLHYVVVSKVWETVSKVKMVVIKVGFLNSDWSVSNQHSYWSFLKPLKVKRSGKKERAHDGLMATIWTWSRLMTSSDNSKSPSARLENLPEKNLRRKFSKMGRRNLI